MLVQGRVVIQVASSASIVAWDASSGKEQALHGHEAVWLSFGFNPGLTSWVDPPQPGFLSILHVGKTSML